MLKEAKILNSMRDKNKITAEEYNLLLQAIKDKSYSTSPLYWLINPFQRVAGIKALWIGIAILFLISAMGVIANVYFVGFFGCMAASNFPNTKIPPNFLLLLYQNLVSCSLLAVLYFVTAKFLHQKKIRVIDFFGTVLLSRFPMLFFTAIVAIITVVNTNATHYNVAGAADFRPTILSTVQNASFLLATVWQIITYFFALKESSGLVGNRLWLSFIFIILLGNIAGEQLSLMVLK